MQSSSQVWFSRPPPEARIALFCFPWAGAGAGVYRAWRTDLPRHIALCPVKLPGRESRIAERLATDVGPLAEAIAEAVRTSAEVPVAFFGHSMGALLAFEVARRLRSSRPPAHLFVSGMHAPHLPGPPPYFHTLPDSVLAEEIRRLGGVPEEFWREPELVAMMLPILRADCTITEKYEFQEEPPLSVPITVLVGENDPRVDAASLREWQRHTTGPFAVRVLPGDHFFLHAHKTALLDIIASALQRHA